ncbi:serine/threonine protein phosphatase [Clostridium folliculivorans]|uniref:Serine/threonine protein phosphatase n=1 Tax=Clostridium folliculivorans TaxID=2886038 RepID=A0A9W5Y647_9CLOT|nr:protein phosphatase 2C domain-containing protein [Clostridium folliculivorans]GKU27245.1 serine/threonine protein phosphatase [Clostridium folliculivorans]
MQFVATADTDIGISKDTNQDSVLIKHAATSSGEILLAIVCDGMGGLAKGELASATVIRSFSEWFDSEMPSELRSLDMKVIGGKWELMLKELNAKILEYGKSVGINLGTTFTGILFADNQYVICHVGDTRVYHIGNGIRQLTEDHTLVAREISRGTMTLEQAKTDRRRNMLLQCVGASRVVTPQIIYGRAEKGVYMICSDGFRHEITEKEIFESLKSVNLINKQAMHDNARYLIDLNKSRQERDNISVVLVKTE